MNGTNQKITENQTKDKAFLGNLTRWLGGIPYEVSFWESYYDNKKRRKELFEWSCYDKPFDLENFDIHKYIHNLNIDNPQVIDVGCSLSYVLGNIIDGKMRSILYVDPLASFYNQILDRQKLSLPRIVFGMIETLSLSFMKDSVDFIHVRNALDHSFNPLLGIINCLQILKLGGILYLNHHPNEAEKENYRGFHQYNIIDESDNLIIWNKESSLNISQYLKGICSIEVSRSDSGNVVAVITKLDEIPSELYSSKETVQHFSQVLEGLMLYFHSFNNAYSYQFKRLYTSIGHKTMRLLPYTIINKIKQLLR